MSLNAALLIACLAGPTAAVPNWAQYEILSIKECQNILPRNYTEYFATMVCGRGIGASTCQVKSLALKSSNC